MFPDFIEFMTRRVNRYRTTDEITKLAVGLKTKDFEIGVGIRENTKIIKSNKLEELEKQIGKNVRLGIKPGDQTVHPLYDDVNTEVISVFEDILGNDIVYTTFAATHIDKRINQPGRRKQRVYREYGLTNLADILKSPELILKDLEEDVLLYCRKHKDKYVAIVVGLDYKHLYTIEPVNLNFSLERYRVIYKEELT